MFMFVGSRENEGKIGGNPCLPTFGRELSKSGRDLNIQSEGRGISCTAKEGAKDENVEKLDDLNESLTGMTIVGKFNNSFLKISVLIIGPRSIPLLVIVYHFEHFHVLNGINITIRTFMCSVTIYAIFLPQLLKSGRTAPSCSKCCNYLKQVGLSKRIQPDLVKKFTRSGHTVCV